MADTAQKQQPLDELAAVAAQLSACSLRLAALDAMLAEMRTTIDDARALASDVLPHHSKGVERPLGATYHHGSNKDCPDVQAGKFTFCRGHLA